MLWNQRKKEIARQVEQVSLMKKLEEIHNDVNLVPRRIPVLRPNMGNSVVLNNRKMLTNVLHSVVYGFLFYNEDKQKYLMTQVIAGNPKQAVEFIEGYMRKDGHNPAEWLCVMGNEMEIDFILQKNETPTEGSVGNFLNCLQYARDKFSENEDEKVLLSKIIKRVEIKHAEKPLR